MVPSERFTVCSWPASTPNFPVPFHQLRGRDKRAEEQVERESRTLQLESDTELRQQERQREVMSVSMLVGPGQKGTACRLRSKNLEVRFLGSRFYVEDYCASTLLRKGSQERPVGNEQDRTGKRKKPCKSTTSG